MWYFNSPQIVFGEGALNALDDIQGSRALVVTDAVLVRLGIVDKVKSHLDTAGLEVRVFDTVEQDPSVETVYRGAEMARAFQPDWIIGLGGGSPMDAAKAIWVLYERPDLEPAEINPFIQLGLRKKARLITVPTTSGTGAEVTWAIVLSDIEGRKKMSLGNRENVADMAIVDPELAVSMPSRLTADTGLDALTHAVEGYSCSWHNDLTNGLCVQAVQLVFEYLPRVMADGADQEARERMHNAATIAGLGFGNSLASMAHSMGHALGAIFHIPHGSAVGLFLPYTIEFIAPEAPERFAALARASRCSQAEGKEGAFSLATAIRELAAQIGSPTSIAQLGISRQDYQAQLDELVDKAFNDASILTAGRSPSFDELAQLFLYAYDGKVVDF
jgi:alcohol dehydrogenase class IV